MLMIKSISHEGFSVENAPKFPLHFKVKGFRVDGQTAVAFPLALMFPDSHSKDNPSLTST